MNVRRSVAIGAVTTPLAGLALTVVSNLILATDHSRLVAAYAVGTLPLSTMIGGAAGRWAAQRREPSRLGRALAGATLAVGIAVVVATIQATIRLRYLGADGAWSLSTWIHAEEIAMLGGVLPGLAALGWAAARMPDGRFLRGTVGAIVSALLVGPTLIVTSMAGAIGVVPALAAVVIAVVTTFVAPIGIREV